MAVTIAVCKILAYYVPEEVAATLAQKAMRTAGMAAITSAGFAAGNTAAQLTAQEMGMLPGGINWSSVWNAAGSGAAMGAAHATVTLPTMRKLEMTGNEVADMEAIAKLNGTWLESGASAHGGSSRTKSRGHASDIGCIQWQCGHEHDYHHGINSGCYG